MFKAEHAIFHPVVRVTRCGWRLRSPASPHPSHLASPNPSSTRWFFSCFSECKKAETRDHVFDVDHKLGNARMTCRMTVQLWPELVTLIEDVIEVVRITQGKCPAAFCGICKYEGLPPQDSSRTFASALSSLPATPHTTYNTFKMSCDFGPIPAPQSPIQDYFERKYRTTSSNVSPPAPVTSPVNEHSSMAEQLAKALANLKKKQDDESSSPSQAAPDSDIHPSLTRRDSTATSTGYAAMQAITGLFKRRSMGTSTGPIEPSPRQPST